MKIEISPGKPVGCTHIYLEEGEDPRAIFSAIARAAFEMSYPSNWEIGDKDFHKVDGGILLKPYAGGDQLTQEYIDASFSGKLSEPDSIVFFMDEVKGRNCSLVIWQDEDGNDRHFWINDYWFTKNHFWFQLATKQLMNRAKEIIAAENK